MLFTGLIAGFLVGGLAGYASHRYYIRSMAKIERAARRRARGNVY